MNITVPSGLGTSFPLTRWQAWITCATALVTLVLLANLAASRIGRSWRAVRDDEVAAALAGLHVARLRVLAFVVSSASAGVAGALLAITTGLVTPSGFTLALSIGLLTAAVVGGLGSLAGAVWGSLVLVFLPTYADGRGHQPWPVELGGLQHPDRRLRCRAHPRSCSRFPTGFRAGCASLPPPSWAHVTVRGLTPQPTGHGSSDGSTQASEQQEEGPV